MIPRPPTSSPSIQPVLRKTSASRKSDNLSSSLHSCSGGTCATDPLSSGSLHSCPDWTDEKYVVISRRLKVHKVMDLQEYTTQEIENCWWDGDELMDIRKQTQAEAKTLKQSSPAEQRGCETFIHKCRKTAAIEMARETILFDRCLMNYALNAKVSLKEAQERARLDAAAVDHAELSVLMKELALAAPPKRTQLPKKTRSKTNLFQEMSARMQRRVRPAAA